MKILHLCKTPCAGAIESLSSAIRDYTEHDSRVVNSGGNVNNLSFPHDIVFSDTEMFSVCARADVFVFHQNIGHELPPFRDFLQGDKSKACAGFYHSHPDACDREVAEAGYPTFVIAQYAHPIWEARLGRPVFPARNVIRFDRADWPDRRKERSKRTDQSKVWIGYAPTFRQSQKDAEPGSSQWYHSKGYDVTMPILELIDDKFEEVEVMIFEGLPYDACMRGKAMCDILIDEVVTGSYHRNTLEGLALGIPTIVNLSPECHGLIVRTAEANEVPVVHATIENLEEQITWLLRMSRGRREKIGRDSRLWMERHWHPRDIAREFCAALQTVAPAEVR